MGSYPLSAFPLSAISRSTCLCKYGYRWCLFLPSPALVVSPPITNATPLTRHISPPFSHPLPSTSFAQDGWESRKGKKDRGVYLNKFLQSYSNVHLNFKAWKCFRGKRKRGVGHVSSGRIDPEAKGDFMCLPVIKNKQSINSQNKRDCFCEYI